MKGPLVLLALVGVFAVVPSAPSTAVRGAPLAAEVAVQHPVPAVFREPIEEPSPLPSPAASPIVVDTTPHVGSRGPAIQELEQRLNALHYMVGKVDGIFDRATYFGVVAFQKVEGLSRNGRGDDATLARLQVAHTPSPRYATPANHLEVDIPHQVVYVVRGGEVAEILPTSTGSGKSFTNEGWTRKAITPNGQFKVNRKINAMRISPLGELYKPSYFAGGIAFHGNGAVPPYPASHGCVRLPMPFADWFFNEAAPIGMVVYVYGGPEGPNPQPYIADKPAPSPSPSTSPTDPGPSPSPSPTHAVTGTVTGTSTS
ncbi:MAG: L,D-transpeptidase family protein [Actinomycetota bacterium]|nr:L,D-transpeptidase family protein [Actinomycetota bacterium]